MRKNLEKYGEIVDARKSGYRSNSIKPIKKKKMNKKSDDDTVLLNDPCDMLIHQIVLPSEDELFADILPAGDDEIFDLDDLVTTPFPERNYRSRQSTMTSGSSDRSEDELISVILMSASVLAGGSVE